MQIRTFEAQEGIMSSLGLDLLGFTNQRRFATVLADPPWQFTNQTGKIAPEHKRLLRYRTLKLADIKSLLAPEGVWCIQLSYVALMLKNMNFYDICNEHLEYYSLAVIERLIGEEGLEVISAELNQINGGSIRLRDGGSDRVAQPEADGLEPVGEHPRPGIRHARATPISAIAPSASATGLLKNRGPRTASNESSGCRSIKCLATAV